MFVCEFVIGIVVSPIFDDALGRIASCVVDESVAFIARSFSAESFPSEEFVFSSLPWNPKSLVSKLNMVMPPSISSALEDYKSYILVPGLGISSLIFSTVNLLVQF